MPVFRTKMEVHLWPTTDMDLTSALPEFTWKGDEVDMDAVIRLTKDREEVEVNLWNIARPEVAQGIFKEGFLLAIDLARLDQPGRNQKPRLERTVLARIKQMKIGDDTSESGDIPFKVTAIPITEGLRETVIRANFPARGGPYYLQDVIVSILSKAGIGAVQVDVSRDYRLTNFTCDDTLWAGIKRAAAKAGASVGIWLQGGTVRVSDRFTGVTILTDDSIFDARREESNTTQAVQPIVPEELQIAGEALSLPEQYSADDDAAQIALDEAPANAGYILEIPLSPGLLKGSTVIVQKGFALNKMGFFATDLQSFNIVGIEHSVSSYEGADVDITTLYVALRIDPEVGVPST